MKISVIIVAVSLGCASANCTLSFGLSNRATEACQNHSLALECNNKGRGLTVFKGDLLECNGKDELILLHNRFENGTYGTCNNGTILGQSLTVNSSSQCYTSLLCIIVSPDMVGKIVRCAHDNGTVSEEIGTFSIPSNTIATTVIPFIVTSVSIEEVGNNTKDPMHTHSKATKSLSSGEVEAIIICCSLFLVGVIIIVIILSIFGFVFKKKQSQAVQTLNSTRADKRQPARSTFHSAQNDEVSDYTLCITDYDRIIIVTDNSEYSHLQHPGPQHALPGNDT